jgi:glycosyltransferase involved in cell wall biosynthesis
MTDKPKGLKTYPFVSVITPTYNRKRFIPYLIECYKLQTYPKEHMEWIILDDGSEPVKQFFDNLALPNIRYYYEEEKQNIGYKRNKLNKLAKGEVIIAMDDDDYYPPERVYHIINMFKKYPKHELAGSSEIYMYYSDIKTIYKLGPYNPNHATNGTMAWKSSYAKSHNYDETVTHAEESSYLEKYKHPMVQLDPYKTMLVMSHSENTFDKKKMREPRIIKDSEGKEYEEENPFVKRTNMKIKDFIKEKNLREFYSTA